MATQADPLIHSPVRGIFLMLSAITVFTLMSAFIKAAERIPAGEAMFFRAFMALPVIVAWLAWKGAFPGGIGTNDVRAHAVRGIVGSIAMGLGFAGLHYLPLPEVTAIRFVTPMILLVLAALLLGERLRLIRISAVALGFVGVIIIVAPRLSAGLGSREAFGALLVLGSATFAALAQVFVKGMAGKESTAAIVFWFRSRRLSCRCSPCPSGGSGPLLKRRRSWSGQGSSAGSARSC